MGCAASRPADQQQLLDDTDDETVPLFEKIQVVLIGCHKAGKNTVANAILGKKAFTHMNTRTQDYVEHAKTIFGRRISVIRVPGWSGDLTSGDKKQENVQQVIKDGVKSFKHGPNAIIVVVKKDTELSETTIRTLQALLGFHVHTHILVFSICGKDISVATINEHFNGSQTMIKPYQSHYFFWRRLCRNQHIRLIETIEYFIASKDAIHFCAIGKEEPNPELQIGHLNTLVSRLIHKIFVLENSISMLQSDRNMELRKKIELKNEEIRKLQNALNEKKTALESLKAQSATMPSVLQIEINKIRDELQRPMKELQEKDKQLKKQSARIKHLEEENQSLKNEIKECKRREQASTRRDWKGKYTQKDSDQLELTLLSSTADEELLASEGPTSSSRQGFSGWRDTLFHILEELWDSQFEKMKHKINFNDKWKISKSKLSGSRDDVAEVMIQTWGEYQCIINMQELLEAIPRNDQAMKRLIEPYLEKIGKKPL